MNEDAKRKAKAGRNPLSRAQAAPEPAPAPAPSPAPASASASTSAAIGGSAADDSEIWVCPVCTRRNFVDRKKCGTCYCDPVKHAAKLRAAAGETGGEVQTNTTAAAVSAPLVVAAEAPVAEEPALPLRPEQSLGAADDGTSMVAAPSEKSKSALKAEAKAIADAEAARAAEAQAVADMAAFEQAERDAEAAVAAVQSQTNAEWMEKVEVSPGVQVAPCIRCHRTAFSLDCQT